MKLEESQKMDTRSCFSQTSLDSATQQPASHLLSTPNSQTSVVTCLQFSKQEFIQSVSPTPWRTQGLLIFCFYWVLFVVGEDSEHLACLIGKVNSLSLFYNLNIFAQALLYWVLLRIVGKKFFIAHSDVGLIGL